MPASVAVPAVSSMGYAGILMGPAFIGFVAQGISLSIALLALSVLLIGCCWHSHVAYVAVTVFITAEKKGSASEFIAAQMFSVKKASDTNFPGRYLMLKVTSLQ
jgi:hypothetical protein